MCIFILEKTNSDKRQEAMLDTQYSNHEKREKKLFTRHNICAHNLNFEKLLADTNQVKIHDKSTNRK